MGLVKCAEDEDEDGGTEAGEPVIEKKGMKGKKRLQEEEEPREAEKLKKKRRHKSTS